MEPSRHNWYVPVLCFLFVKFILEVKRLETERNRDSKRREQEAFKNKWINNNENVGIVFKYAMPKIEQSAYATGMKCERYSAQVELIHRYSKYVREMLSDSFFFSLNSYLICRWALNGKLSIVKREKSVRNPCSRRKVCQARKWNR